MDEVKTLIARLEQDRQQTIRAYQREVERVKLLQVQVDKVERRRLYILPKAVQLGELLRSWRHGFDDGLSIVILFSHVARQLAIVWLSVLWCWGQLVYCLSAAWNMTWMIVVFSGEFLKTWQTVWQVTWLFNEKELFSINYNVLRPTANISCSNL